MIPYGMIELRKLLENEKQLGAGFLYQLTDSPFWKTLEIKSGDFLACIGGAIFFDTEAKGKRSANVTLDGGTSSQVDVRIKRSFVGLWLFSGALSPEAEKHILDTVLDLSDEAKIDDELIKADFDNFYFAEILEPNTNATHPYCFSLELDEEGNTELSEMQAELLLKAKEEQDYNGENPLIILSKDKRL